MLSNSCTVTAENLDTNSYKAINLFRSSGAPTSQLLSAKRNGYALFTADSLTTGIGVFRMLQLSVNDRGSDHQNRIN